MNTIDIQAIFGKDYNEFSEIDPFNPQNKVSGYISRKPTEFYGALIITHINDKPVNSQLIMGSPKMHYPFQTMQDGSRKYNFPIAKYIEAYEKIDGCVSFETKILLVDGTYQKIGKLYERVVNGEKIKILNYDFNTKEVVIDTIITAVRKFLNGTFVKVKCRGNHDHSGNFTVNCTSNHKFYTEKGWKEAGELLVGDRVFRYMEHSLPFVVYEMVKGCILGDGILYKQNLMGNARFEISQCQNHREYIELILKILKDLVNAPIDILHKNCSDGWNRQTQYRVRTKQSAAFNKLYEEMYSKRDFRKLDLTPISLAFWYMDDGSLCKSTKQRPRAMLHTQGFSDKEIGGLSYALRLKGIDSTIETVEGYKVIVTRADASDKFFSLISPYIPKSMHYKLPESYRVEKSYFEQININMEQDIDLCDVIGIEPSIKRKHQYDLHTNNGNYFANDYLVHNTNILSYSYSDGDNQFTTFKTRLRPFLTPGRFGDFLGMWREVATDYFTEIEREMDRSNCNLSFELFGSRNTHLIVYDEPLTFKLLFGVTNEGKILSPTQLKNPDLPILEPMQVIDKDYALNYEATQKELQSKLKELDDGYYAGMEGTVWYLQTPDGKCIQLKNKPETIETIHFTQGLSISKNSIIATCWNAFENTDTLTLDFIAQLLLEEFPQHQIDANHILIHKCIQFVTEEAQFKAEVLNAYKTTGMNILLQKTDVMRQLSTKFPKNKMKKVYSIIAKG